MHAAHACSSTHMQQYTHAAVHACSTCSQPHRAHSTAASTKRRVCIQAYRQSVQPAGDLRHKPGYCLPYSCPASVLIPASWTRADTENPTGQTGKNNSNTPSRTQLPLAGKAQQHRRRHRKGHFLTSNVCMQCAAACTSTYEDITSTAKTHTDAVLAAFCSRAAGSEA